MLGIYIYMIIIIIIITITIMIIIIMIIIIYTCIRVCIYIYICSRYQPDMLEIILARHAERYRATYHAGVLAAWYSYEAKCEWREKMESL